MNVPQDVTETDKISTGVPNLDRVLGGGYPNHSLILVAGNPGTGKTILSSQFLHQGALRDGEKGVYVSFAESRDDYIRNMAKLGLDMRSLEENNSFKFLEFATMEGPAINEATELIMKTIASMGAKRFIVDSIGAMLQMLGSDRTRIFLHTILGKLTVSTQLIKALRERYRVSPSLEVIPDLMKSNDELSKSRFRCIMRDAILISQSEKRVLAIGQPL